jgi:hypothetical protein
LQDITLQCTNPARSVPTLDGASFHPNWYLLPGYPQADIASELALDWNAIVRRFCARSGVNAMHGTVALRDSALDRADTVVPLGSTATTPASDGADLLDSAGQTILGMLGRAAEMAAEKSKQALEAARELSVQLQAAEGRIRDLEADVRHHEARADRAEKWLYQISVEIEEKFFGPTGHRAAATPRQTTPEDYYAPRRRATR